MGRWREIGWVGAAVLWALVGPGGAPAEGAKWSRGYINALPDAAFAAVEEGPDGARARHLPHHDAEGRVDLPHLRNALSRWHQVQWMDAANADRARQHLLDHFGALGLPAPGEGRARQRLAPRPRSFRGDARPLVVLRSGPRAHRAARTHR